MQMKMFTQYSEEKINTWLSENIGRGTGPDDPGKKIKFVTQSEVPYDNDSSITICIWYE